MLPSSSPEEPMPPDGASVPAPEASVDGTGAAPAAPEGVSSASEQPAPRLNDERRSSPRRRKLLRVQLVDTRTEGESFPGWVVDRSFGGLRLEVERVIEPGSVLKV